MNVLPQRVVDKRLIVSASRALYFAAKPAKDISIQPDGDPLFRLGHRNDRTALPLTQVIFSLHKFSVYTLRSQCVASRAEINRTFSSRHE
jgi:hypothetical protein